MGANQKNKRKVVFDMETLSKKTAGAAPTSANLEDRLLEAQKMTTKWRVDASVAQRESARWKARHASLAASSALITLASAFIGFALGLVVRGW